MELSRQSAQEKLETVILANIGGKVTYAELREQCIFGHQVTLNHVIAELESEKSIAFIKKIYANCFLNQFKNYLNTISLTFEEKYSLNEIALLMTEYMTALNTLVSEQKNASKLITQLTTIIKQKSMAQEALNERIHDLKEYYDQLLIVRHQFGMRALATIVLLSPAVFIASSLSFNLAIAFGVIEMVVFTLHIARIIQVYMDQFEVNRSRQSFEKDSEKMTRDIIKAQKQKDVEMNDIQTATKAVDASLNKVKAIQQPSFFYRGGPVPSLKSCADVLVIQEPSETREFIA